MSYKRTGWCIVISGLLMPGAALPARADGEPTPPTDHPTRAEFSKLQADVRDQKKLIIQLMQNEQQRYDMLLRLIQGQDQPSASGPGAPSPSAAPTPTALDPSGARAGTNGNANANA